MTELLDLAIKYGGFTALDRVYLEHVLLDLTPVQRLRFITPPPSVINAYFAEIYDKRSPQAAMTYFFELSQALALFNPDPSFEESKPFVRLNLSGQAYGLAFVNEDGWAQVFPEVPQATTNPALCWQLAQLFPDYQVGLEAGKLVLRPTAFEHTVWQALPSAYLLTDLAQCQGWLKFSGPNVDEVQEAAAAYPGQPLYAWSGRTAMIYKVKE